MRGDLFLDERLRDDVLLLRFLKMMGFPNVYGELVRGSDVGVSCDDLLSRWRSSGLGVISLDHLIIMQCFNGLDGVSLFSNLSWDVYLEGVQDAEEFFLEGLGGYWMGSKFLLDLGLFVDLLSVGIFEREDIEKVSFVCEVGKRLSEGYFVEMYLYSYILGVGGSFSVLGGGLSVGDWDVEREFMRAFLSCGAEDICDLLFSVGRC